jgi:2-isopropylmalate synthase
VIRPERVIDLDKIIIFDTTLRDGEQSSGAALNVDEKLQIAHQLAKLGVDVIEAGFPIASPGDSDAVRRIAGEIRGPVICGLTHATEAGVDAAWEAVKGAEKPRIHVFLSSSDLHITHQLKKKDKDGVLEDASRMVARAKGYLEDVEFSPMDASRTDPEFLYRIIEATIDAGATTINVPDTVGYTIPREFCALIEGIRENVPNISKAVLSVHCHDDLGLAVANSLAVLDCGVRQIECTINGIGERAGNASLEEIVMAVRTRSDLLAYETGIDTTELFKTSRLVSELTGMYVQPNKAIVGRNAFAHESGIHQDGVLKASITYEIMDPKSVGQSGRSLTLGKLSGRAAFRDRLSKMGYTLSDEELGRAFAAFKELADKKREIKDRDLEALVAEELRTVSETYHLDQIQVSCGDHSIPTASVRLIGPNNEVLADAALGDGPVDAVYRAINRIVGVPNELIEFSVGSITEGIDAIGEVMIRIRSGDTVYTGRGASTDIVVASAKAYMNALNRLLGATAQQAD